MNCQTCASGYKFLNNACHPYCPTGLVSDGLGGCSLVNSTAFNLNPSKIQGVIYDNISSIPVLTGSSANFYPTLEADDPYPLQSRGYYFSGSSIMKLPPSALFPTPLFLFGNTFMISAWIFHMSDGTLLSTQSYFVAANNKNITTRLRNYFFLYLSINPVSILEFFRFSSTITEQRKHSSSMHGKHSYR